MSKLAKAIKAEYTGDAVAIRKLNLKFTDVNSSVRDDITDRYRVYRVGATFGVRKVIDKFDISDLVMSDIKRAVVEEIFGEFRPIINEMRVAIYEKDDANIRRLINELESQMFSDGIES